MQAADQKVKSCFFNTLRGNGREPEPRSTGKKCYRCGRFLLGVGGCRWRRPTGGDVPAGRYGELPRLEIDATLITLC